MMTSVKLISFISVADFPSVAGTYEWTICLSMDKVYQPAVVIFTLVDVLKMERGCEKQS